MSLPKFDVQGSLFESLGWAAADLFDEKDKYKLFAKKIWPYSPELNPIERVWKLTRRLCLHNVYLPKLDQVCATAEQQFDQWSAGSSAIQKLCAIT
jgi:hypothetical protein